MAAAPLIGLTAVTAGKTISDFAAQRSAATSASREGEYALKVYGINADLADAQAEDAVARGHESSLRLRTQAAGLMGTQRTAYASSGVDPTVGSAATTAAETKSMSELDRITIANNAAREAHGFRTQAASFRAQGALALASGRNQAKALRDQSYGTLLGGAADLYHLYQKTR
jgi:hypothetical protein